MTEPRPKDSRDIVDGFVHRHQLDYSLSQLRLVGLLLLSGSLGCLLLEAGFGGFEPPPARLSGLMSISPVLPLLPLGSGLYLLGGGHRRHRREQPWAPALHRALLPLGLIVLVVFPVITILDAARLASDRRQAGKETEERLASQQQNLERIRAAGTAAEIARLGRSHGLTIPAEPGESKAVGLWRYDMSLERQGREAQAASSRLSLSPLSQDLLNPVRLLSTLLLQGITGAGLLLLREQGLRMMRRVGLTPSLFFRTDATGPVRQRRSATRGPEAGPPGDDAA
jgi:hypothetical protein